MRSNKAYTAKSEISNIISTISSNFLFSYSIGRIIDPKKILGEKILVVEKNKVRIEDNKNNRGRK